jgi:hypothetical protein
MAINKRNEIENFIYTTREKLKGDLGTYVSNADQEILLQLMQTMEDWLYSGDENVYVKSILEERAKSLNELGTNIYKRYHDWERLKESLFKLGRTLNELVQKTNDASKSVNLNQTDKEEITKLLNDQSNLLNQLENQVNTLPKIVDPPQKWEDVDKKTSELDKVIKIHLLF